MSAWEIIRKHFCKNTTEGTLGRDTQLNDAADLFLELQKDGWFACDGVMQDFNEDRELTKALLIRKDIQSMRKAGVLR